MHFNKDSNKVPKSAVLEHIVKGLDPELQDMVMTVSAKVGKQEIPHHIQINIDKATEHLIFLFL
jgi:hypothetical protein